MKINLDSPRTELQIRPSLKKKAHLLAAQSNLSFNQFIEQLIDLAEAPGKRTSLREEIADLQKKTAQLDARLHNLQQKKSK